MDNNLPYEALPSYWRNSKRELNKAGSKADSTFANIRKRLKTAIISVPYERGLSSLNFLEKGTQQSVSPIDKSFLKKVTKENPNYDYELRGKMPRSKNTSENTSPRSINLAPIRPRARPQNVSPHHNHSSRTGSYRQYDTTSLSSRASKIRSERIGSETSTTSNISNVRPFSFSSAELDESFWMNNIQHIEELKEKYSANSQFVASIHGFRYQKEMEAKKKEADKIKMENAKVARKPKSHDHGGTTESVLYLLDENSSHVSKTSQRENDRVILPPINHVQQIEEDRQSQGSGWTLPSCAGSTRSKRSNKENAKTKKRKVEFNLIPKKKLVLPPLSVEDEKEKHPIKSILKKDIFRFSSKSPVVSPNTDMKGVTMASWEDHLPRLRSPVPLSAARKDPIVFRGNSRGFYFKCSKEFEAALDDIETE